MEPDGSLTRSQVPAIAGLYREVAENFTLLCASEHRSFSLLSVYAATGGWNCQRRSLPSVVNLQQFT